MLQAIKRELNFCYTCLKGKQLIILLLCAVFMVLTNDALNMSNTIILLFGLTTLAFTELEAKNKVFLTILSTNFTRKKYVISKYVALSLWLLAVSAIGCILGYVLNLILPNTFTPVSLTLTRLILCYCLLILGVYLIMYFCLGIKFARLAYLVSFILYFIGFFAINNIVTYNDLDNVLGRIIKLFMGTSLYSNVLSIVITLLVLTLFCVISLVVYEKKDF